MSESQPQLLPFSNDVFLIRNTSNNLYLTLSETRPGAPIILAERTWSRSNVKKLKWVLRDQGTGADDTQVVTLQYHLDDDLGFFGPQSLARASEIKYSKLAWSVRLQTVTQTAFGDHVTIRYTKGSKDLAISANENDNKVILVERSAIVTSAINSREEWIFELSPND